MAGSKAVSIELSAEDRLELEMRVRRRKSSQGAARRARIVLLAAAGVSNSAISEKLGLTRKTVGTWRQRFAERGLAGLDDEPRPGAPRQIGDEKIAEVVTRTLETVPEDATHWSRRSMARASGMSATTVHRIWGAFGLQPHRVETFKLSSDPLVHRKGAGHPRLYRTVLPKNSQRPKKYCVETSESGHYLSGPPATARASLQISLKTTLYLDMSSQLYPNLYAII